MSSPSAFPAEAGLGYAAIPSVACLIALEV